MINVFREPELVQAGNVVSLEDGLGAIANHEQLSCKWWMVEPINAPKHEYVLI